VLEFAREWNKRKSMRFNCLSCSKVIEVSKELAERIVSCPYCAETMQAPPVPPSLWTRIGDYFRQQRRLRAANSELARAKATAEQEAADHAKAEKARQQAEEEEAMRKRKEESEATPISELSRIQLQDTIYAALLKLENDKQSLSDKNVQNETETSEYLTTLRAVRSGVFQALLIWGILLFILGLIIAFIRGL